MTRLICVNGSLTTEARMARQRTFELFTVFQCTVKPVLSDHVFQTRQVVAYCCVKVVQKAPAGSCVTFISQ